MRTHALKTLAVAAALPLALTACSSNSSDDAPKTDGTAKAAPAKPKDPNAGVLTGTQLKKALAPATYFASGFAVDPDATRDTGDTYRAPVTDTATKPDCSAFGGTAWIEQTGIKGVSFAQASYVNKTTTAELDQEIDAYRGTTSTDVMAALRKVVEGCPGYTDTDTNSKVKITGVTTPGLGDDAYTITLTSDAWETGTTLVAARLGTNVVTVLSTDGPSDGAPSAKKLTTQVLTSLKSAT
ncbi:hypothetical protein IAG44_24455 [Streptomyces roseirectus]|uniref:PknH-like extracellular domain-containing protein n=1 Tax=Streptomyces roseirectus TaxID=2768066 RepID=A0A7H0IHI9_9ACTN|nr:hypothetical protein [Streptomyces roseirectus]QNP72255.1 hypothetical protein IAG44_24455 [Streptomyces roseirectus]